jgi:ribonuclease HIII
MNLKEKAHSKIKKIEEVLAENKYEIGDISERQFNFELPVNKENFKAKVQIYFGKKGIKIVLQGNTESEFYNPTKNLVMEQSELNFGTSNIDEPDEYIGSDESGKGDFFGPLVTAAVFVNKELKGKLVKLGVRDSKELSDYQIDNIAREIKKLLNDNFEIVIISPVKYNELYDKFGNLNKLLNWSHSKAIENLLQNINCKEVITDKFSKDELNITTSSAGNNINFVQTPKAERYTAVAAASILARNSLNIWFASQKKKGFNLPKGASQIVEETAKVIVKNKGKDELKNFAKMHFKTSKRVGG